MRLSLKGGYEDEQETPYRCDSARESARLGIGGASGMGRELPVTDHLNELYLAKQHHLSNKQLAV